VKIPEGLTPEERRQVEEAIADIRAQYEANPLNRFHSCPKPCGLPDCRPHPKQHEFLSAKTPVVAAFAGNRFGKTSGLTVKTLCQCLSDELLPERLRAYRAKEPPVHGRIVGPDLNSWLYGVILPEFRKWTPAEGLLNGSFDKSWDKVRRILTFANGSSIQFHTYEMDLDKFGGPALDFVGYDEPPPQNIRNECRMRLMDRRGFEMFAMTPLMGIGWLYRNIFKARANPDITVVQASIHDNPHLDPEAVSRALSSLSREERKSREFGEFAHFGGMVYSGGFESNLIDPPAPVQLQGHEIVVGIDPGLRVAAFVWVAFDRDNRAHVFHEEIVQAGTAADYAKAIRAANKKWGVRDPIYVIDPSARNRSLTNAESVESELRLQGIYTQHGQNDVLGGVQQVRLRLQQGALFVSRDCYGLRDEAEEYREDAPKHREGEDDGADAGEFKVVKQHDHRLDALRYAVMSRLWTPERESAKAQRRLAFAGPGFTPDISDNFSPADDSGGYPDGLYA
jgi:phage terminase large subunit-like protein